MASTVSPAVIKKTQQSLGKFVSKPQLTEKLLSKPPFRFLHDIVSAVIRDHHVLVGLLDENELKSDSVADKDAKVRYLDKLIACIAIASGVALAAKPGKIVSGQEPEKTNEVLQVGDN
jgi:TRAF3-interacting protein 1